MVLISKTLENCRRTSEQVLAKLDPLWGGWGWCESVGSILCQVGSGPVFLEAILAGAEPLVELLQGDLVYVQLKLLLQVLRFTRWKKIE